ncbi:DUF4238 domain-containing protein [Shewanella spartinae]|uniref:DUF4238 domain-containing protein n=1 Tax=Shewanella spartinae TaxID=2864205 RepID=UPI001C657F1D|nr:DUF4238 domain-containing protein [Shewanella spartinae]QYJ93520.1 DUF4238 domain-containing protein [Shewanella spartinae]
MVNKEPKKQHYVPQFLLRNFALGEKKHIHIFDIRAGKRFTSHVKDAGHENNFYHHPEDGNQMEFELGKLETQVAPIIDGILSNGSIKHLSAQEILLIGLFTVVQMIRVNSLRESLSEMTGIIFEKVKEYSIAPGSQAEEFLANLSKQNSKTQSIEMLKETPQELLPYLLEKSLVLEEAPEGESFYLSDNPIIKYNNLPRKHHSFLGLRLKGIEVHFPISPKYCLSYLCSELIDDVRHSVAMHQREVHMGLISPSDLSDTIKMLDDIDHKNPHILTSANMDYHNSLQVLRCSRFVYSNSGNFELLEKILKKNPNIAFKQRITSDSRAS